MFSLLRSMFVSTTNFIENDLKEVVIHSLDTIFFTNHVVIDIEYMRYDPKNIQNV